MNTTRLDRLGRLSHRLREWRELAALLACDAILDGRQQAAINHAEKVHRLDPRINAVQDAITKECER